MHIYCRCSKRQVDYVMVLGLEEDDGNLPTPMTLAHPLLPLETGRGISGL